MAQVVTIMMLTIPMFNYKQHGMLALLFWQPLAIMVSTIPVFTRTLTYGTAYTQPSISVKMTPLHLSNLRYRRGTSSVSVGVIGIVWGLAIYRTVLPQSMRISILS